MARTYTKKTKMNTVTQFSDLLSAEEMEFFPSLDLSLPFSEFGSDIDDVFQENTLSKDPSQDFSADDILQELDFESRDKLLETDWLTQKFDFSSFDPGLATTSETLEELTQVESTELDSTLVDLNDALLIHPMGEEQFSIPVDMPTTPVEQKVPEFLAVSPYSVDSAASPGHMTSQDSSQSSPCSPYSDSSNESTVSLADLLANDSDSITSLSPSKETGLHVDKHSKSSKRETPYSRNILTTKPKVKSPAQKQRKRVQNKDAATRYRVKKRSEQEQLFDELSEREKENTDLKEQMASISKEIEYLKNLMLEVYKTKQQKEHQKIVVEVV